MDLNSAAKVRICNLLFRINKNKYGDFYHMLYCNSFDAYIFFLLNDIYKYIC